MAPRIRELLETLQTERTELMERLEALQTRLDQSPGQQQVNQLQTEMGELRTQLQEANDKLATLQQTPPPNPNPENEVATLTAANVELASKLEAAEQANRRKRARPNWS